MYISYLSYPLLAVYLMRFGEASQEASHKKLPLPANLGPYAVEITARELVDYSRQDPYAPSPQCRKLMVSVFLPQAGNAKCSNNSFVDYMPEKTARYEDETLGPRFGLPILPNGTFEALELPICKLQSYGGSTSIENGGSKNTPTFPVALFSPGLGMSRLFYSSICQAVASAGFNVISIDHPYDADVVEFPDGSLIFAANINTEPQFAKANTVRVADTRFVLDSIPSLLSGHPYSMPGRTVMFGHSLGGATTTQTLLEDSRLIGGVNLDGGLFGSVVSRGTDKPLLLLENVIHNQTSDATWAEIWPKLTGPRLQLTLANSTHGTFTDIPFLAEVTGLINTLPPGALDPFLGSLEGKRALQIIQEFVVAWLSFAMSGKPSEVLKGPSADWPEVLFTNGTLTH